MIKSPLARALVGGFLLVVLLQALCIGYLCSESLKAERSAAAEHRTLQAAAELSSLADVLRTYKKEIDAYRVRPDAPESIAAHNVAAERVRSQLQVLKGWRGTLNPLAIGQLEAITETLLRYSTLMFTPTTEPGLRNRANLMFNDKGVGLYSVASQYLKTVYESVNFQTEPVADKWPLVVGMLIFNIVVAIALVWLIQRQLAAPLTTLSNNCRLIASAQMMPPASSRNNEISALEKAFYDLSVVISENDKGRRSYLEILQASQTARLQSVRDALDGLKNWPQTAQVLPTMRTSLDGMLRLLHSLTEALNQRDQIVVRPAAMNTQQMFSDASAAVDVLAKGKGIKLVANDSGHTCSADPQLIQRVVVNLLSNAIKFSPENAQVEVTAQVRDDRLVVSVMDHGPGIAPADREKLFERFSQVERQSRDSSGLGLSICKQLIDAHGGEVGCESTLGEGSTFWFAIPLNAPGAPPSVSPTKDEWAPPQLPTITGWLSPFRGSIKSFPIIMLSLMLVGQALLASNLYNKFEESQRRAALYARQKDTIMQTQLLIAHWLNWRQQAFEAVRDKNFLRFVAVFPLLEQQSEIAHKVADQTVSGPMHDVMLVVAGQVDDVRILAEEALQNFASLHREELRRAYSQRVAQGANVEDQLFAALKLENDSLNRSYDVGDKLRGEILSAAIIAGVVDIALLFIVVAFALHLLLQLDALNAKVKRLAGKESAGGKLDGNAELAHLDQCLERAAEEVEHARESRQHLMAVINHDLRSPLTSVLAGCEMLMDGVHGDLEDDQFRECSKLENDVTKLLEQINDLLMIEKADAGLLEVRNESIDLNSLVQEAAEKVRRRWKQSGVQIKVEPDSQLLTALGDRDLVEWVCRAAIENAFAASPSGAQVVVTTAAEADGAAVRVQDTGTGIEQSMLDQLYERFRFIDGKPVTGLGLPLAHRLCALQKAQVVVEETSPAGTAMKVSFRKV